MGSTHIVCFRDEARSRVFTKMRVPDLAYGMWTGVDPVPYAEENRQTVGSAGGVRLELLYQGVDGSTLRLTYREYKDDLARPAFFQQLSYTLAPGTVTEISFRGADITIFEANNREIRYVMRRGFRNLR